MSNNRIPRPTDASIILTYRCPMRCVMCNIWKNPTNRKEELKAEDLKCLPNLKFINLTGGEPFIREDLAAISTPIVSSSLLRAGLKIALWLLLSASRILVSVYLSRD